jgi:hypothetical protein
MTAALMFLVGLFAGALFGELWKDFLYGVLDWRDRRREER